MEASFSLTCRVPVDDTVVTIRCHRRRRRHAINRKSVADFRLIADKVDDQASCYYQRALHAEMMDLIRPPTLPSFLFDFVSVPYDFL